MERKRKFKFWGAVLFLFVAAATLLFYVSSAERDVEDGSEGRSAADKSIFYETAALSTQDADSANLPKNAGSANFPQDASAGAPKNPFGSMSEEQPGAPGNSLDGISEEQPEFSENLFGNITEERPETSRNFFGSIAEKQPGGSRNLLNGMAGGQPGASEDSQNGEPEEYPKAPKGRLDRLKIPLERMTKQEDGVWSIYVKDLGTGEAVSINSRRVYAASLIKLFVMESSYSHMSQLLINDSRYSGGGEESEEESYEKLQELLAAMIEISDNEAYNELVRMHSGTMSFPEGCMLVEKYIRKNGYRDTGIYHTLMPSASAYETIADADVSESVEDTDISEFVEYADVSESIEGTGGFESVDADPRILLEEIGNYTSVKDCAALLESVYRGTCVSKRASEEMLELLLSQQVTGKIPAGLPEGVKAANKTGETDEEQHDAAIVFGPETDYILCITASGISRPEEAVLLIQEISAKVYEVLEGGKEHEAGTYSQK